MKLYGRVLLLAACVLSAYAVHPSILASLPQSGEDTSMGAAETTCTNSYNQAIQTYNQQVASQVATCLSGSMPNPNLAQIPSQINTVRTNLTSLQNNIASCLAMTDNLQLVTCVANGNDVNQHLLNNANEVAQNAEGQLAPTANLGNEKNCVGNVLSAAKKNISDAANTYNKCLSNVLQ